MRYSLLLVIYFFTITVYAQSIIKNKLSLTAGYGLAGSFFVRSFKEFAPFQNYKSFEKKRFIGSNQNLTVHYTLRNNWSVNMGINYQHFTRHINSKDTIGPVILVNYQTLHDRNYMLLGSVNKSWVKNKNQIGIGVGVYYLRSKSETVQIYNSIYYYEDFESDFKKSKEEEGGVFAEFFYEYKFQPKVGLGIKTQFYYTISTGEPESISLFPYIKIYF